MEHQMLPLSKENTKERKHKSARILSFSLPNPSLKNNDYLCVLSNSDVIDSHYDMLGNSLLIEPYIL